MIIVLETLDDIRSMPIAVAEDRLIFHSTEPPVPVTIWGEMHTLFPPSVRMVRFHRTEECVPVEFKGELCVATLYREENTDG